MKPSARGARVLLDTNVWVGLSNRRIHPSLLKRMVGEFTLLVPTLVLSELSSLERRGVVRSGLAAKVARSGKVVPLSAEAAIAGGALHGKARRASSRGIGLVDALLIAVARSEGARILTTDEGLGDYRDATLVPLEGAA